MTVEEELDAVAIEREIWTAGDYGRIAREMFWEAGERIVERTRVAAGERVLDVACGTGNAALRAARAGAVVTGVDLTPDLLSEADRAAREEGLRVDWLVGDAEDLPVTPASFDVVLSTFGCMFAPRHRAAAEEVVRALAPGGCFGICSWTPRSSIAALMPALFANLPPAPMDGPPPLWGDEDYVAGLFGGLGVELEFLREELRFGYRSVDDCMRHYETVFGPFVKVREMLEPAGRWGAVRSELAGVLEERNEAADGSLVYSGEYLTVLGRKS